MNGYCLQFTDETLALSNSPKRNSQSQFSSLFPALGTTSLPSLVKKWERHLGVKTG